MIIEFLFIGLFYTILFVGVIACTCYEKYKNKKINEEHIHINII